MKILVFDTETTGLPEKYASIYEHDKWPHIIQLSYILYDMSNNTTHVKDNYIKINSNIVIPIESYNIHKIDHEILNEKGVHIISALREFNEYLKKADIVVGHNISFDKRIIIVECLRNNIPQYFTTFKGKERVYKPEFCTMKKTTEYCNIEKISKKTNKPFIKTPSLTELYLILFPESILPKELHNSLVDILITLKCYIKYNYSFDITEKNAKIHELCNLYNCL